MRNKYRLKINHYNYKKGNVVYWDEGGKFIATIIWQYSGESAFGHSLKNI